jgi:U3 small nucleolar ribonucleoprotein protein IMP3
MDTELQDKLNQLLDKLYTGGIVPTKKGLAVCDKLSASSLCRRRLPVVLVRLHMSETLREAVTFVEQGHIRVGPDVVTDPAFLVTRPLEDFITWTDSSKIKRKVRHRTNPAHHHHTRCCSFAAADAPRHRRTAPRDRTPALP